MTADARPISPICLQEGRWKFGLKDLGLASTRASKMNIFPLLHDKADLKLLEEIVVKEDDDVENDKEEQLLVAQSTIKKD